jgi:hypothetical protein
LELKEKAHCHHFALRALLAEDGNVCGFLETAEVGTYTMDISNANKMIPL